MSDYERNQHTSSVIFIVGEGPSDVEALNICATYNDEISLRKISNRKLKPRIEYVWFEGDPTTEYDEHGRYRTEEDFAKHIVERLSNVLSRKIEDCARDNLICVKDIERIAIFSDMDGVFVDDSQIDTHSCVLYTDEEILTDNPWRMKHRNRTKRNNLKYLLNHKSIPITIGGETRSIPISLYFMSCNLDHVTYNERNMDKRQKFICASKWNDEMTGNPSDMYRKLLDYCPVDCDDVIRYKASWRYITKPRCNRSLSRCTNAICLFDYIASENGEIGV